MSNQHPTEPDPIGKFLYPHHSYKGVFTPENLVFNANLQEFAQRIIYLCGLENNGKITPEAAYQEIRQLWKQLRISRQELRGKDNEP